VSNHCQENSIFKSKHNLGAGTAHQGCKEGMGNKIRIDSAKQRNDAENTGMEC
jgi:hypothetical protein